MMDTDFIVTESISDCRNTVLKFRQIISHSISDCQNTVLNFRDKSSLRAFKTSVTNTRKPYANINVYFMLLISFLVDSMYL